MSAPLMLPAPPPKLPEAAAAPAQPAKRAWIGGLDGLRAVAVIAVVLFHLDPGYLGGGFLGVDLFFVISGYLITRLLLGERRRTGRIALGRFYVRRARRLLPAVALLLAVVGTVGYYVWPDQRPTLPESTLSSLGYVTNWWLIADKQSYFVAMGRPPMLQHLWSLAIEEQYYLLWAPVVIILSATWLARRRPHLAGREPAVIAAVAACLALASTVVMVWIAIRANVPYQADSSRVYFGTDTHAMGLLLGSAAGALAGLDWRSLRRSAPKWVRPAWRSSWSTRPLLPAWIVGSETRRPVGRWATDLLAVAALGGVAWFFVAMNEFVPWLYRGGFLLFAAVAIVGVCCAARPGSIVGRMLDVPPLRWIGVRSYGIYLWHWPVFVVTRPGIDVLGPTWLVNIARTGLAVAVAAASYRYLETPIRRGALLTSMREATVRWRSRLPHAARSGWSWALPAVAAVCVTVLVTAHLATMPQPAWAASVPSAALPIPGASADLAPQIAASERSAAAGPGAAIDPEDLGTAGAGDSDAGGPGSDDVGSDNGAGGLGPIGSASGDTSGSAAGDTSGQAATAPIAPEPGAPTSATGAVTTASTAGAPPAAPTTGTSSGAASVTTPPARTKATGTTAASATTPASTPTSHPTSGHATTATAKVSAFGDSVLLGASPAVRAVVGSMSLDAVVGRQAWDTLDDVMAAEKAHRLAPIVLIHTGNNGIISPAQLASTLAALHDRTKVLLVNDHVDRSWQGPNNRTMAAVTGKYANVTVLDWNALASRNPGWFGPDGIHVNQAGGRGYAAMIAAALK